VTLRHFTRVMDGVDVGPIRKQLEQHPELWDANKSRKDGEGSPHTRMSDIWVRYNSPDRFDPANPRAFNNEHVPVWYPAYAKLPALKQIIFDLMALVDGEMLCGVLITRIPPGGGIAPHVDEGWHVEFTEKFYLSINSAPGADFVCEHGGEAERLNPKPGEIWLFDNRKRHWVENNSAEDRITLIVCIRTALFGRP
jgi:hypothetical protein